MERQIRKWKRFREGTLDRDNRAMADSKVKEWESKLQEHLSNNKQLRRDRIREEADIRSIQEINYKVDTKEYANFKSILGDEAPKTLEEFQNLKYNDSKSWNKLVDLLKKFKDKDHAMFDNDLPIPDERKQHIWIGENKFKNPNKPEQGGGILRGGGHGQGAIDLIESNYKLMESRRGIISDKKLEKRLSELGFEYKEYDNGVRFGNIFGARDKSKNSKWGQTWFPKEWTQDNIIKAGQHIVKLTNKSLFDVILEKNNGEIVAITKYGKYDGVSIGVIVNYDSNKQPYIGTIFPDKDLRFTPNVKEKGNTYYKKGER